jgi:hypothetical protein
MMIFEDDDATYRAWLAVNPNGLVVNSYRTPSASYLPLHSASCICINCPSPPNGKTWTGGKYIKVCSLSRDDLVKWALKKTGGQLQECGRCF